MFVNFDRSWWNLWLKNCGLHKFFKINCCFCLKKINLLFFLSESNTSLIVIMNTWLKLIFEFKWICKPFIICNKIHSYLFLNMLMLMVKFSRQNTWLNFCRITYRDTLCSFLTLIIITFSPLISITLLVRWLISKSKKKSFSLALTQKLY